MTAQTVEEAAHEQARAVITGDVGTSVRGMTPDGLANAMELGNTRWTFSSYEVASQRADGDDFIFDIIYEAEDERLTLTYRFSMIDGQWKVVHIQHFE